MDVTGINKNNANFWQVTVLDPVNYLISLLTKNVLSHRKALTDWALNFRTSNGYTDRVFVWWKYGIGQSTALQVFKQYIVGFRIIQIYPLFIS